MYSLLNVKDGQPFQPVGIGNFQNALQRLSQKKQTSQKPCPTASEAVQAADRQRLIATMSFWIIDMDSIASSFDRMYDEEIAARYGYRLTARCCPN